MQLGRLLRSYLTTALRVIERDPVNSAVTFLGLALSLAAALLITLYVWDEHHYDASAPGVERMVRVETVTTLPGRARTPSVISPGPLREALQGFADVEQAEHLTVQWSTLSRDDDPTLSFSHQVHAASMGWFDLFPVRVLEGDVSGVLTHPEQVLISASLRDRLFPGAAGGAVGRTFRVDGQRVVVAAVMQALPHDTHLAFELLSSTASPHVRGRTTLATSFDPRVHTYARLRDMRRRTAVESQLERWAAANLPTRDLGGEAYEAADLVDFRLRPVRDIHLQRSLDYRTTTDAAQMKVPADLGVLGALTAIAVTILVIGGVNYVNLATARALGRTREVAMRKVAGASRVQLMSQFLGESALYVGVGAVLALVLIEWVLAPVNAFVGKSMELEVFLQPQLGAMVLLVLAATAVLAGLYPALYLAGVRPRAVWAAATSAAPGAVDLRKALVLIQFAASITLIACTLVMHAQTTFARNLELGYDAEDVVVIYGTRRDPANTIRIHDRLEDVLRREPAIVSVSGAASQPDWGNVAAGRARRAGSDAEVIDFEYLSVDLDYFETFRIETIAGRMLDERIARDRLLWNLDAPADATISGIVNESATRALGFDSPEAAVDTIVDFEFQPGTSRPLQIVGVVPDTHFKSIRSAIVPLLYYADPTAFSAINVRFDPARRETALAHIDRGFREVLPLRAISRDFVDEQIRLQYEDDARGTTVFAAFALLAIVVSGLGLYGVAALTAERRTREIGMRKVLGASVVELVRLMVWQFSRAVLWANLIAWPLAWWLMREWLGTFAYRIELTLTPFVIAGVVALAVAVITVVGHCGRVARLNPAYTLQRE